MLSCPADHKITRAPHGLFHPCGARAVIRFALRSNLIFGVWVRAARRRSARGCGSARSRRSADRSRCWRRRCRPTRRGIPPWLGRWTSLLDVLLHLGVELLHDGGSGFLAAVAHHGGHIVEQLKAADGRGLVVHQVVGALPEIAVALGDLHDFFKALVVPGLAGEGAQIPDELVDLRAHIAHARFGDAVHGVIAGVDEKYGDIELTGEVFVPLGQQLHRRQPGGKGRACRVRRRRHAVS